MTTVSKQNYIITVVIAVILIIGAYFMGASHATKARTAMRGQYGAGMAGGAARAGGMTRGAGFITGSVLSIDSSSITLKEADGSTKIVLYSGSTQVMNTTAGTISDVAVGSQVSVQGTTNTDGSTTASTISIRPAGSMTQGGGAAGGTQAPMMPATTTPAQ